MHAAHAEDYLLSLDLLPLRLRGLAATEQPIAAATLADTAAALEARAARLARLAYVLAEHGWDLAVTGEFLLEARRRCRRAEVERLLDGCPELAALATVYLDAAPGEGPRELFWAEDECRLVAA
ncbi:MAG TPA: hypothetical protein VFL91_19560 [Thermomicrobiales bacterium]|nr:hypothetical protein [Thermomicrobiales bacterium]